MNQDEQHDPNSCGIVRANAAGSERAAALSVWWKRIEELGKLMV